MDFDLNQEQALLKESLERLLARNYSFEDRRRHGDEPEGWSASMWDHYVQMGLTALPFAQADGGIGAGPVETMLVMEALGRALVLEPYFSTVVLGGGALRLGATAQQKARFIPAIAEGRLKLAFAHGERHARFDLHHVETSARRTADTYVLNGAKSVVLHGDSADMIFVTARTRGDTRDEHGIGLFLVDADAAGLSRHAYRLQDGTRAAEATFENVDVPADRVIGDADHALPLVHHVVDQAIAALTGEAIGVMSAMHELTLEHLKMRKQFGVPISSFQVLQHQAVDMYVAIEQARSMALFATQMADEDDAVERARAMHAAKVEIGRSGRLVGEAAIQLHGGVGMTMDHAVGHYFKRITMIDLMFGDADHHLRALARLGGLFAAP